MDFAESERKEKGDEFRKGKKCQGRRGIDGMSVKSPKKRLSRNGVGHKRSMGSTCGGGGITTAP